MANKVKDITGQKFGKLTVLCRKGYTNNEKRKYILWLCRCDCGNEVLRTASHLKSNYNNTCGECNKIKDSDYIGKTFGYWTVIKPEKGTSRKKAYLCKCICGKQKIINEDSLRLGTSKSCGCYHKEKMKEKLTKHGQTGNRIMTIYYNIKNRCYCENNNRYKDYGGRGIEMCEEWKNDSTSFVDWSFKNGYNDNLTIDRIDNDGNYCPENCRWISAKKQSQNRRSCVYFTFFGVTKSLKEWCECIGENYTKIYGRYYRGYETFRSEDIKKIEKYIQNGGI